MAIKKSILIILISILALCVVALGILAMPRTSIQALAVTEDHFKHEDGWIEMNADTGYPIEITESGKYYLTSDINIYDIKYQDQSLTIRGGCDVTICLNGYKLIGFENLALSTIVVRSDSTLTLCDCNSTNQKHAYNNVDGRYNFVEGGQAEITGGVVCGSVNNYAITVNNGGKLTLQSGTIAGNKGGIYVAEGGALDIQGGTICGNNNSGVRSSGTVTMSGGYIKDNTAFENGGGLKIDNGSFTMSGGYITNNVTPDNGGGVYVNSGNLLITQKDQYTDTYISNNTAKVNGGGVYINSGVTASIVAGNIVGNTATVGGGVYSKSDFTVSGGEIVGNIAKSTALSVRGGGMYMATGTSLNLSGGALYNNEAQGGDGGAIYVDNNSQINVTGGEVFNNTASGKGKGLFVGDGATLTVTNGSLSGIHCEQNTTATITGGYFGSADVDANTVEGIKIVDTQDQPHWIAVLTQTDSDYNELFVYKVMQGKRPFVAIDTTEVTKTAVYDGLPLQRQDFLFTVVEQKTTGEQVVVQEYSDSYQHKLKGSNDIVDGAPTNAGTYTVYVTVNVDGVEATATIEEYTITQATNEWTKQADIAEWAKGDRATHPQYLAKFGTVQYTYKKGDTVLQGIPTEKGDYTLVITVDGTDNYTELQKTVQFTITQTDTTPTTPPEKEPPTDNKLGLIIGLSVGGACLIAGGGVATWLIVKKRKNK